MMLFVYTFLFQDLLRVLSDLLDRKLEDGYRYFLGNHESLLCIHTVLSILSGQVILIFFYILFTYVQKKSLNQFSQKKCNVMKSDFTKNFQSISYLFTFISFI